MDHHYDFRPNLAVFGVSEIDPGFLYIVEDRKRFKIGQSKSVCARFKAARTWIPDMELVGCKPFWEVSKKERSLHVAFCQSWYCGEWFTFNDVEEEQMILGGFEEFSDSDRDVNSVDFIYWFSGTNMLEFVVEQNYQKLTVRKFLEQHSCKRKAQ